MLHHHVWNYRVFFYNLPPRTIIYFTALDRIPIRQYACVWPSEGDTRQTSASVADNERTRLITAIRLRLNQCLALIPAVIFSLVWPSRISSTFVLFKILWTPCMMDQHVSKKLWYYCYFVGSVVHKHPIDVAWASFHIYLLTDLLSNNF